MGKEVFLMADMDIKQVVTTLKNDFSDGHQIVFWYDDDGGFKDSISELTTALADVAIVIELMSGHQLETKLRLLNADQSEKFLVYSPQPQPPIEENHLRDMVLYSVTFKADAQEILRQELGLPTNLHRFLKDHKTFFANKVRRARFAKFDIDSYHSQPAVAIMATITRLDQPLVDFFGVLKAILKADLVNNKYLNEFKKYGVLSEFWDKVHQQFNFESDPNETQVLDLSTALYVTMAFRQMDLKVPAKVQQWNLDRKIANVQTFMQQFSASEKVDNQDSFAQVAAAVWQVIDQKQLFRQLEIDDIARADVFKQFDKRILLWIQTQLKLDISDVTVNGVEIDQLTKQRETTHYGQTPYFNHLYQMMCNAWWLKKMVGTSPADNMSSLINDYLEAGYLVDTDYRHFVYEYQQAGFPEDFQPVKNLVEAWYVDYLSTYAVTWNRNFNYQELAPKVLQRNFYKQYVGMENNRIVVIISDSLRFEVAKELQNQFSLDDQINELNMHYLVTGLPSVTYMGMSALLPHRQLALQTNTRRVAVDGMEADNVKKRQLILQQANPRSVAYRFKELKSKTRDELRTAFAGQDVIYIYHNQIDTTAENQGTEDETFAAANEAINELRGFVNRLRSASIAHLYITADHGYLYRDEKLKAVDKIELPTDDADWKAPRYLITKREVKEPGINRQSLATVLNNEDERYVYYPTTANVFRANGGDNYVHGGSSLQEMLVPLLEIRTSSDKSNAQMAELQLVNTKRRITSLEVPLSIMQPEPISATVVPTSYKLYFVDDQDHQISGQLVVNANSEKKAIGERIQTVRSTLIDQVYNRNSVYYLVIENLTDHSISKLQYTMDLVNPDDI
ncbi:BREX-1 system phosphatase PglZ type A [Lactobacillus sp. CBA3606]|nr:BREX-1 system phosphatase PglZ type A [Lactobacillus sp. CBA3606]